MSLYRIDGKDTKGKKKMKKVIVLFIIIVVFTIIPYKNSYASEVYNETDEFSLCSEYDEFEDVEPKPEDVFSYISNNIIDKTMNFQGENELWKAVLVIEETLTERPEGRYNVILTLTPKIGDLCWTKFSLISNKGVFSKDEWQIFLNPVKITSSYPLPVKDEEIVIVVSPKGSKIPSILFLNNVNQPADMISSDQAINVFIKKYYETFGVYPLESFTYEITTYKNDWLITYDDNDGIGGESCLLIDGKTGEAYDIKTEE